MNRDFNTDFQFSLGEREKIDCDIIRQAIPNCCYVKKTTPEIDRKGIDYIATLNGGATINIDAKTRRKGAVKKGYEPCLALEMWSIKPCERFPKGKAGWTCNSASNVDMILYTFDKTDWNKFYLIPYQHLRMAFQRNWKEWWAKYYHSVQKNNGWESEAVFVPASVVLNAVKEQMTFLCEVI